MKCKVQSIKYKADAPVGGSEIRSSEIGALRTEAHSGGKVCRKQMSSPRSQPTGGLQSVIQDTVKKHLSPELGQDMKQISWFTVAPTLSSTAVCSPPPHPAYLGAQGLAAHPRRQAWQLSRLGTRRRGHLVAPWRCALAI